MKDQNIQLTIEAARKIRERSRELVRESSTLIETAISLSNDGRRKLAEVSRKPSARAAKRRAVSAP